MTAAPCPCWLTRPYDHEGHCCFADDPTPLEEIQPGQDPPCGHWPAEVPRPEPLTFRPEDLRNPDHPAVIAALTLSCGICATEPRQRCRDPGTGQPLPDRIIHSYRIPKGTKHNARQAN